MPTVTFHTMTFWATPLFYDLLEEVVVFSLGFVNILFYAWLSRMDILENFSETFLPFDLTEPLRLFSMQFFLDEVPLNEIFVGLSGQFDIVISLHSNSSFVWNQIFLSIEFLQVRMHHSFFCFQPFRWIEFEQFIEKVNTRLSDLLSKEFFGWFLSNVAALLDQTYRHFADLLQLILGRSTDNL